MAYTVVTSRDRPDLVDAAAEAFRQRWPEFIFHDPIPPRYMPRVHQYFPEYDILLLDQGQVAAGGWGVPFAYDGRLDDLPEGTTPPWCVPSRIMSPAAPRPRSASWPRR